MQHIVSTHIRRYAHTAYSVYSHQAMLPTSGNEPMHHVVSTHIGGCAQGPATPIVTIEGVGP